MRTNYTRDELVALCESAIIDQDRWMNRDTPSAQMDTGKMWALLKANCEFRIETEGDICATDENTIWVRVWYRGFGYFDAGNDFQTELFYLPQPERLAEANGGDWY